MIPSRMVQSTRIHGLIVGAAMALAALILWGVGWLDGWEGKTWDVRARMLARPGAATDTICLILVDQQSLDWGKTVNGWPWPWPREIYGAILDYCRRAGARVVAMDLLFTEPSAMGVYDDAAFAAALAACGKTVGAVSLANEHRSTTAWPTGVTEPGRAIDNASGADPLRSFAYATFSIPEIARRFTLSGNVTFSADADGIYRRIEPFARFDDQPVPALGLAAYLAAEENNRAAVSDGHFCAMGRRYPLDSHGRVILRYRGPASVYRTLSAAHVLRSEAHILEGNARAEKENLAELAGKYVFIGYSAPGLYDLRPSPVSGVYPGVAIHATLLDNLLSGDFIAPVPGWATMLLVLLLATTCAWAISVVAAPMRIAATGAGFLMLPVPLAFGAYTAGYQQPLVVMELAILGALFGSLALKYATEGRQKRFIKQAFRQYLSPAVIDKLLLHPENLRLGGERKTLSIFFSDLQGFTTISEKMTPEQLTDLLNTYLTAMTDIITEEGGTVDKYEGDAIIAFWNAPVEVPGHAIRCVTAALRCQARLSEMQPEFERRYGHRLLMRIGINTGEASVGNFGSHTKFDYTIIGDAVNLAARLEGANKQFGTYTMISEATFTATEGAIACRKLGTIAVKGREHQPVTVYEPMPDTVWNSCRQAHDIFAEGLEAFAAGEFHAAGALFDRISGADPAAREYADYCRKLIKTPPAKWRGIWILTSK